MAGALEGLRVIDFGTFVAGPMAAMLLADQGADVIRIERPGAGFGGPANAVWNRGKRAISLDLKSPDGRAAAHELALGADVLIENFRPSVMERLGIGYEALSTINPRLIYGSISGSGPHGPSAQRPSYDTVAQAASGYLKLLVNPANPRVVGPAIADAVTGFYAAYGVLGALYERSRTGVGRKVEVSMLEAMSHWNLDAFTHYYSANEVMGPFSRPRVSQSYVLECKDGKWIALHMSSPEKFWQGLANAIDKPDMFQDPRFATREARIDNQEAIIELLSGVFKTKTREQWCNRLLNEDVPHAPMYGTDEALEDPQARHLQLLVEARHPTMGDFKTVRPPVTFDGERALKVRPPPTLGEHNAEIDAELKKPASRAGSAA
jgi:crotonobetainyl-CoA:carnitine CoA-transferase CaiB-like acyl-CoA transferase